MGGFADVFQYEQLGLNRTVAVKVLLRDLSGSAQQSFEAEANLMAKLSNHPSIVSVYQAGQAADGRPYLVMEYCPPPHLAARIKKAPLSISKTLEIGVQIASAVEMAHRFNVLHRDIKPANILFTEYGRPALTDFGISVTTESASQGQGVGMSVPWSPPEQLTSGQQMGPASDVYSLAATLWTTLTGRSPFELPEGPNDPFSMSKRVKSQPVPALQRQGAPASLELILSTALAKDPALRYSSALEFARALQGVQTELHLSVTPIDIRESQEDAYQTIGQVDTGTEVISPILINPDGYGTDEAPHGPTSGQTNADSKWSSHSAPSGPFIVHGRGSAPAKPPREFTASQTVLVGDLELGAQAEGGPGTATPVGVPVDGTTSAGRPTPNFGVVIGVLVGAVLVGGGTFVGYQAMNRAPAASQSQSGEPSQSVRPQDPIGEQVSMPVNLVLEVVGDEVKVSWRTPTPRTVTRTFGPFSTPARTRWLCPRRGVLSLSRRCRGAPASRCRWCGPTAATPARRRGARRDVRDEPAACRLRGRGARDRAWSSLHGGTTRRPGHR